MSSPKTGAHTHIHEEKKERKKKEKKKRKKNPDATLPEGIMLQGPEAHQSKSVVSTIL